MKKTLVISLCLLLVASFALARNVDKGTTDLKIRSETAVTDNNAMANLGLGVHRAAAADTTVLAFYTFDAGPNCVTEGFLTADVTAQTGDWFHVDDFAGLGGGVTGLLVPLEGAQSLWCGVRENLASLILCGYATMPGYGNTWNQAFCTANCLVVTTGVAVNFSIFWDSEGDYDATTLQMDLCDDVWVDLYGGIGVWDGMGTDTMSVAISDTLHTGTLRVRFNFNADGAWSDQDGLWNTDGAVVIDELGITDAGGDVLAVEDFEGEAVGDTDATDWVSCTPPGYGDYGALYPGLTLVQEDPCRSDYSCMWTFYTGSTVDYSCGGWPAQTAVPYENSRNQYIISEVWSPDMAVAGAGSVWEIAYDVYRDLPLGPLMFYVWHVRNTVGGCPGGWNDFNFVYYGGDKDWLRRAHGFGVFIDPAATHISVAMGVQDMCQFWNGIYGDCLCHSHSPMIDNLEVYRVNSVGPQWNVRDLDLFQDNFSQDGTITGTARADAANDIRPSTSTNNIVPGDSVSVEVGDPDSGLGLELDGRAAVYCYVRVDGPNAGATGATLLDNSRYTMINAAVPANGETWTQIQMDTSYTAVGSPVDGDFNIDLNDNLFVPGDTVWFFFGAASAGGNWTYYSEASAGPRGDADINYVASVSDEFTILPAAGYVRGGDILYVDGMNFRGAQPYFDTAFQQMNIFDEVDRYDIRGPSSAVANHPGSRVQDVAAQLVNVYDKIVYNTGNLDVALGDGSGTPDKSDDTGMMLAFLNQKVTPGGVYLSGDDIADTWLTEFTSGSATALRTQYMSFGVQDPDHTALVDINPWGVGTGGGFFFDGLGVDTLVAFGGCPVINGFDVLQATGTANVEMNYVDTRLGTAVPAIVSQVTTNPADPPQDVKFVLAGFSFHYIRDAFPAAVPARSEHMHRILTWLGNIIDDPVGTRPVDVTRNALDQNHPNPFNPTTTIRYEIKTAGPVSLKIYNVAGQLVKTLVDGQRIAGQVYKANWNGLNDAGQSVSSGVYFYKLVSTNFTQTKKMVLLK